MADILLTVGVDTSLSYAEFQSGITSLVSKINSNPPKIKVAFDIDQTATNKLKQQISAMYASMGKTGSGSAGTSYMQGIANGAKAANSQISATKAHLNAVNAALKEINATNTSITSTYKNLSTALGGANATGQNATDLSAMKAKYLELQNALETLRTSKASATQEDINNIYRLQSEMQNLMTTTQQRITTEREAAAAAQQAAKAEADAVKQAAKAQAEKAAQAAAAEQIEKRYYNTLNQMQAALRNYTAAENSANATSRSSYAAIQNGASALQSAFAAYQNGSISIETFKQEVASAITTLASSTATIKANGDATQTLAQRMGTLSQKFASWLTVSQVVMMAVRAMKQMVSASVEIESAMAQIQIVTGATNSQMEKFLTNSTSLAKELGQSITDVAGSIETFARLGYNMTDSTELAKYANILANIADTDTETATTGLTSIIKGYDMEVADAQHVADVLTTVGQEYAISAEELMAAFERGGAALAASGTDFEKSAALFAATNAALQNAETTGTMWKTVSARIRGATTELEEMGEETEGLAQGLSKYRDEIKALSGVDIMKDENTYKDMYDIFVSLAEVWDDMEDVSQSRVAEILGGTRNTSGIMSTITNISDALGAYESAMNSAGAATAANDIYMDTTQAKLGQLKATFQEFASDLISSDLTKGVVSFGNSLLNLLDSLLKIQDVLGYFPTLAATIGGVLSATKNIGRDKMYSLRNAEYADGNIVSIRYESFLYCSQWDTLG